MRTRFAVPSCHVLVPCNIKSRQHLVSSGEDPLRNFTTPAQQSRLRFRYRKPRLCRPVVILRHPFSPDEKKRRNVMHCNTANHCHNTCGTGHFSVFVTERKPLPFTDPQGTAEARLSLMKLMQLEL